DKSNFGAAPAVLDIANVGDDALGGGIVNDASFIYAVLQSPAPASLGIVNRINKSDFSTQVRFAQAGNPPDPLIGCSQGPQIDGDFIIFCSGQPAAFVGFGVTRFNKNTNTFTFSNIEGENFIPKCPLNDPVTDQYWLPVSATVGGCTPAMMTVNRTSFLFVPRGGPG